MKKSLITLAITASAATLSGQAVAGNFNFNNAGHWIVRGGAAEVMPIPQETKVSGTGVEPSTKAKNKKEFTGALSLTYLTSPHIGFQLAATIPASLTQDAKEKNVNLGKSESLQYQQAALTAQYYFMPNSQWQPYVGLGVAYNRFDVKVNSVYKSIGTKFSVGSKISPIAEAGVDYYINSHWLVNASLSYTTMKLRQKLKDDDDNSATFKYNFSPVVARLNIGYRF